MPMRLLRKSGYSRWAVGITIASALMASSAAPAAAAEPGLLGDWRFDELGGQVALDDGPQRLDGVLGIIGTSDAADPERIAGASGGGLHFDGSTFVRLPDSASLAVQALTVEAVVRAESSPGSYRYVMSRGGRGCVAGSYGLYTAAAGGLALYVFDGTRYVVSATAWPADVWNGLWHHVAGTFDGQRLVLHVDGRQIGAPMTAPLQIDYASTSIHASLGQYAGDCELSFRGDMDLVRLWSGARSAEAIGQAATSVVGGAASLAPLSAAAPGTTIAGAEAPSASNGAGSPRRTCSMRLVRTRVRSSRSLVTVGITRGGRGLSAIKVVARRAGARSVLAAARTNPAGQATLSIRDRRPRRLRITVHARPRCGAIVLPARRL